MTTAHPVQRDRTVMAVFEAEDRPALVMLREPFDGFHEVEAATSVTCLVRFDHSLSHDSIQFRDHVVEPPVEMMSAVVYRAIAGEELVRWDMC